MSSLATRTTGARRMKNSKAQPSERRSDSLAILSRAIEAGGAREGPIILEGRLPETRSVHLVVIWDGWRDVDAPGRSRLILDAATSAKRLAGSNVTVALGLDPLEALRLGYLPFAIRSMRRRGDRVPVTRLAAALKEVGGIASGSGLERRFATREQAEAAYRRLCEIAPGPYWLLVRESDRDSDQD